MPIRGILRAGEGRRTPMWRARSAAPTRGPRNATIATRQPRVLSLRCRCSPSASCWPAVGLSRGRGATAFGRSCAPASSMDAVAVAVTEHLRRGRGAQRLAGGRSSCGAGGASWRRSSSSGAMTSGCRGSWRRCACRTGRVWTGAEGRREVGPDAEPATATTPWVIGSITKSFVAALALTLQEEGRLSLEDPIATWVPGYPNGDAITLRMLLSHTSGIADYFWHPDYESLVFGRPTHAWTVDGSSALAAQRRPLFPPAPTTPTPTRTTSSPDEILEIVGGEPLSAQLRSRFFVPLGLTDTVLQGEEDVPAGAAKGYLREDHAWIDLSDGTNLRPNTSAATVAWAAGAILPPPPTCCAGRAPCTAARCCRPSRWPSCWTSGGTATAWARVTSGWPAGTATGTAARCAGSSR